MIRLGISDVSMLAEEWEEPSVEGEQEKVSIIEEENFTENRTLSLLDILSI